MQPANDVLEITAAHDGRTYALKIADNFGGFPREALDRAGFSGPVYWGTSLPENARQRVKRGRFAFHTKHGKICRIA
jgi:hypothetical protein